MIYTYENLIVAYFSINERLCLVSLGNPTFSHIFPRARHIQMTFEFPIQSVFFQASGDRSEGTN